MTDTAGNYFERIEDEVDEAFARAEAARSQGRDPSESVEIPVARDMADRVQNLLGYPGVAERIRELESEMSREEAALALAAEFADGSVGNAESTAETVEQAVRTAVALLTEGVVAAPIEGIDGVDIEQNDDGSEYVRVYYAGPIRSAGGTAQALSVLVADYTRSLLDIAAFQPRDDEVERFAEEIDLYDSDTGLQYTPSMDETRFITSECPICLDGEPTSDEEVSGYRDLERIDTNRARGGMCLVLAEGIALKAPKIQRYTDALDEVDWPWLDELIEGTVGDGQDDEEDPAADEDVTESPEHTVGGLPVPKPSEKFLADLIAGRPVFTHPSRPGGFRLRYGRARNHGFATAGVHPATMHLLDDFLATGTQVKTERPGKAAGVIPVDTIEGPMVRLATGEVRRIEDTEEAIELRGGVERIIDVGEYLVNAGEFVENNYPLAPAAYAVEWWEQELEAAGADVDAFRDDPSIDLDEPSPERALAWAQSFDAPLHPRYTYLWHDIDPDDVDQLSEVIAEGSVVDGDLLIESTAASRTTLEHLLVPHFQEDDQIRIETWQPMARSLGIDVRGSTLTRTRSVPEDVDNGLAAINALAPFELRAKAPSRVGNRMGRPEKSEQREMRPAVHTLFPIGNAGGDRRDVADATRHAETMNDTPGLIEVEVGERLCPSCSTHTDHTLCETCGVRTIPFWTCPNCDRELEASQDQQTCPKCETEGTTVTTRTIDIDRRYHDAMERLGERESGFEVLKGVKGLMSAEKTPEAIDKGILRSKHEVSAFKDGTVRYDMTDLPVTSVRPVELSVTADQFRALGYEEDIYGDPLRHDDQLVELQVQDVILSTGGGDHLVQTANFVDDLLVKFYDQEPYYEVEDREDLVGELVLGLAPHTSAAVVGRIVGFTSAAVGYAHPYFHAAKRRNCFHPDSTIWYENDTGSLQSTRIDTFVENRLSDVETDDFGTQYQRVDESVRVLSVDSSGEPVLRPISAVSKHPSPDHLIRIDTTGGRSLRVTPDHKMIRWKGNVEQIEAAELQEGDRLPVVNETPTEQGSDRLRAASADGGTPIFDSVERIQIQRTDVSHTYCITVPTTHAVFANGIAAKNCDGDEDCVMLLMDGLLNFSRHFLPESRGGSVAEDSDLLAVSPQGDVSFLTFDEFWKRLDTPTSVDGKFEKKSCFKEGWKTYVFDERHRSSLKPIEKAIRYRAARDETLLQVETQFGRSLEITANHSLFRYNDGIEEVAGSDLDPGDLILAPRSLEIDTTETTIDVATCTENPYVVIDDKVSELLTNVWEGSPRGGEVHSQFKMGLSYRLRKGKIPLERFERILDSSGFSSEDLDISIATQGSANGVRRFIELDGDLAWLLGVFVAEGTLSMANPAINNADRELIDKVCNVCKSTLDHEPSTRWSNGAYEVRFPAVFVDVLYDLGFAQSDSYNSSEKAIPQAILRAPRPVVLNFLRGFIAGDGRWSQDGNVSTIAFYSVSNAVKDGIVFLLHRLGIVPNVSHQDNRPGNRQPIWVVTVSGGADDNPLARLLAEQEPYLPKSLVVQIPESLMEIREIDIPDVKQLIPKYLKRRENISLQKLSNIVDVLRERDLPASARPLLEDLSTIVEGDLSYLRIKSIEEVEYDGYLYDLQVGGEPIFTTNWLYAHNSMDAPLVMSTRIDPAEIDDEAHNMDVMDQYPLEFYEGTLERKHPGEIDLTLAEASVGTDSQYTGFAHTHDTSNIALGPDLSAYKTLDSMMDKMDAQLELARKLRAVDETDVAERVIESHFLPDLIGNLRAFASQETRCLDCGTKYRRMPLTRTCRYCDGNVVLTVHEGSVNKYMETALRIAKQYGCREYTIQRLELLELSLESVFENDHNKQSGIADFM